MHTGQMMTVIGALTLLSLVSLTINSMLIGKTTTMLEAEAQLNAISLAQSMIDEIMVKPYDAAVATGAKVFDPADFTGAGSLGCSGTENSAVPLPDAAPYNSTNGYNDVDDYHRYRRTAFTPRMGNFSIIDTIYYVVETDPDTYAAYQTFHKKVVVTVRHPNMSRPLQLSDVAVYRRYF